MLQTHIPDNSASPEPPPPTEFRSLAESLAIGVAFIRRHLLITLLMCFVSICAALIYLIVATPTFTARAELVIDSKGAPGDPASVSTIVGSHIAIIKSEAVARAVIRRLALEEDPEFAGKDGALRSMIRSLSRLLGARKPVAESDSMQYAQEAFERRLSAKRMGVTYIVEITFESSDPERAAQILNAVAETHILASMDAKYKANLRSEKWVKDRMNELSSQASTARKALADYHKNKGDVAGSADTVGGGNSSQSMATETQGDLRELEVAAEAAAKAYDNFLRMLRYMDATQQQSLPVFEARLLTEASPPYRASWPKARIVLGIAMVVGIFLGITIGMLRDLLDRDMPARRPIWLGYQHAAMSKTPGSPHLDEDRRARSKAI